MLACTPHAVTMGTDFLAADASEGTARRTGYVQRPSTLTGKPLLALVTFGAWSEAKTTLAQLAAKANQLCQPVASSAEALHPRMHTKAMAFLQDLRRHTLAQRHSRDQVSDDGLFPAFTSVYSADSPGCELPDERSKPFPGAGGGAARAGAKMQAVWDDKRRLLGHLALTPWNRPDQRAIAQVGALAQQGLGFLFEVV